MYTIKTLFIALLKMFVRDRQALFFTFFMPFIIMAIFGFIGFDEPVQIELGLVTDRPTESTQHFIDQLDDIEALVIHKGNEDDEKAALDNGDRSLVMIVPNDLIPSADHQGAPEPKTIEIFTNAGQPQQSQTALTVVNQLFDQTTLAAVQAPQLFDLKVEEVNSRNLRYIDFLIPGVVAMAIMQLSIFAVAFFFTELKEKGILKRLLATPMKPGEFVAANVINRVIVMLGQSAVLLGVSMWLFDFQMEGSYLLLIVIAILGSVMFLSLGFTISGVAKSTESVPALANLIVFPMLFLGGTFFPMNSMPDWLANIVQYMPLTYLTGSMRAVMNEGAGFAAVSSDIYWMLGWAIGLVILATLTFRFDDNQK